MENTRITAYIACPFDNFKKVGEADTEEGAWRMAEDAIHKAHDNNLKAASGYEYCYRWIRNEHGNMVLNPKRVDVYAEA